MARLRMMVTILLALLVLAGLLRGLPSLAAPVTGARATRVFTLEDGTQPYRVAADYTTTIGGLNWRAWTEQRPFDEYGRELPYHQGWHYVKVAPTAEISPSGEWGWDLAYASLSYLVTETVSWKSDAITPTGWLTFETGMSPTIVVTIPTWTDENGDISGTVTTSMVITHVIGSAPVAGAISVTKYISQAGQIVPGSISATLWMVFEVPDSEHGLNLDWQGHTGVLTIAAEQPAVFHSGAANVADFGRVQFQVKALTPYTDTVIAWRPQFAPAIAGRCAGDLDWADGAVEQWPYLSPDSGAYTYVPMYRQVTTIGAEPLGFDMPTRGECVRVAFEGPLGVTFTPTIAARALNP